MRARLVWSGVALLVCGYAWAVAYTMVPIIIRSEHVGDWDGAVGWSILAALLTMALGGLLALVLDGGLEWAED